MQLLHFLRSTLSRPRLALTLLLVLLVGILHGQTYMDLVDFDGTVGARPSGAPVFDSAGNMYLNTSSCIVKRTTAGTFVVLHTFGGTVTLANGTLGTDGSGPVGSVTFDSAGNMFGTAYSGGAYNMGMLWELTKSGSYIDLHDFGGSVLTTLGSMGLDGQYPVTSVAIDSNGNLFGATVNGGGYTNSGSAVEGMIWEYTAGGQYKDIHDLGGTVTLADGSTGPDGQYCYGVTVDAHGNLFGTTVQRGKYYVQGSVNGFGNLWEITAAGQYLDLHDFGGTVTLANGTSGADGANPDCTVAIDSQGNLYGTTIYGGASNVGILWKLSTSGVYKDLHDFGASSVNYLSGPANQDGTIPELGLTIDAAGDIFGVASQGGPFGNGSYGAARDYGGALWEYSASGTYLVLHAFGGQVVNANGTTGYDGMSPNNPAIGSTGNLFGVASAGGPNGVPTQQQFWPGPTGYGLFWEFSNPGLASLSISPTSVGGGATATGKITLNAPAPTGGVLVILSSNNVSVSVPTTIGIPAGSTSATFAITTAAVSSTTSASISAQLLTSKVTASLTINPAAAISLQLNPPSVGGGSSSVGKVTLASPAGSGGKVVSLSSSSTYVTVPASVTIPAGATSATFTASTTSVPSTQTATVTATAGVSATATATLTVTPAGISSLVLNPSAINGGQTSTGTVTLVGPAGYGGVLVTLASNLTSAVVPASVTVPAGATSATFSITTSPVNTNALATITATNNGSVTATLTVNAAILTGITLNPATVTGGTSSTGTVYLNGPAGSAGAVVGIGAMTGATVPPTVTVAPGASTATFTISTSPVASSITSYISAAYGSHNFLTALSIVPATLLSGLSINPSVVYGGYTTTGTVNISAAAPPGGSIVNLTSSSSSATVPSTVTVPAGQLSTKFTITTMSVTSGVYVTISAIQGHITFSVPLSVQPAPTVSSVILNPSSVTGGNSSTGTVSLTAAAPPGGSVVSLGSTGVAGVPATVTVGGGSSSATFLVTTASVSANTTSNISATLGIGTKAAVLTINAAGLTSVSVSPDSVMGGANSTGTVTLASPAPTGGVVVSLSSSNSYGTVPSSVTVPSGTTTATFTVATKAVGSPTGVTITATQGLNTRTALLTLNPPGLSSVSVSPTSVVGGNSVAVTVTLFTPAPAGGSPIYLSSNSADAPLHGYVMVQAGATAATLSLSTTSVASSETVTISAVQGSVTKIAQLTITPLGLSGVSVAPSAVVGGTGATGTVSLYSPAPTGGLVISLSSSDGSVVVPTTVTVPAAGAAANFAVTTKPVSVSTTVTITATLNGVIRTTTITVNPPVLAGISLSPSTVVGGTTSLATITLTGNAPSGGVSVNLSSTSSSATVPATVLVPAGSATASFNVTTSSVVSATNSTISASYGGVTVSQTLTINPPSTFTLTIAPTSVIGGTSATGTVTLGSPAPSGGVNVNLSSSSYDVKVPSSVTIAAGQTVGTFTLTTSLISASETATITASAGSSTSTASLTLNPSILDGLSLSASTVVGGNSVTGTVYLSVPAPAGGSVVNLSITGTAGSVPATVTVPAGATSATFTITTTVVTSNVSVTVSANQAHITFTTGLYIHNP